MVARITLRLRQPLSGGGNQVAAAARVVPRPALAHVLGLLPGHVAYAEVEDALWLVIKERRLYDFGNVTKREGLGLLRLGGHPTLCAALGVEPSALRGGVSLPVTELPKYLHHQLSYFEPPPLAHTLREGRHVSAFDLELPEDDPLHVCSARVDPPTPRLDSLDCHHCLGYLVVASAATVALAAIVALAAMVAFGCLANLAGSPTPHRIEPLLRRPIGK